MAATMKGLLKGLRYISQIFDDSDQEKEKEMQIGHPTNVKHVAHIGLDGPSANSPSWMNEFKSAPQHSSAPLSINRDAPPHLRDPEDCSRSGGRGHARDVPKPSKSSGHGAPAGATQEHPVMSKHSRRRHSAGGSTKELGEGTKPARRHKNLSDGVDVNLQDSPVIPKHSRRKKASSKESSSSSGSSKSRLKANTSPLPDADGSAPALEGYGV